MIDFELAKQIIKANVTSLDVADTIGLPHDKYGRCVCPFHEGANNPTSFKMYPIDHRHDGGYYCHSCHASGDVIRFVQKLLNLDYTKAINWFNDTYKLNLPSTITVASKMEALPTDGEQLVKERNNCTEKVIKLYRMVEEEGKTEFFHEWEYYHSRLVRIEERLQSLRHI